mgnify:CR=1 FL=1
MALEFIMNNLTFFIFVLVLTLFLIWKRKNLTLQGYFPFLYMLMYKTKLGLGKMKKWSDKHPRVFLYLAYLSTFIGLVGAVFIIIFLIWQLWFILVNNISTGGGLVLPIQTDSGLDGAIPIFYVPFWYWLIALFILAIVHEFAHGVIAERFKIKIKSSGFAFLGLLAPILPAAFVEPDEKQMSKKPRWQQIAVLGAGSTSNLLFGFLFLFMWIFMAGPVVDNTMQFGDISFNSVLNESSLNDYNVSSGSLVAFDGVTDKNLIIDELSNLSVNSTHNLTINSSGNVSSYLITTYPNSMDPSRGMIGISGLDVQLTNKPGFEFLGDIPIHFERLLFYIWFLNIAIGLMNLLPIWITDGGQIARVVFSGWMKKEENWLRAYHYVSLFSLLLIIFTVWPGTLISLLELLNFL